MPWLLRYSNDLDGRITRNGHRVLFRDSGDVAAVETLNTPVPGLLVRFRAEPQQTDSPTLRQIHDQYGAREDLDAPERVNTPFTHRLMEGFTRLLGRPNQNGDVLPEVRQQIIDEYLRSQSGRQRLAQQMTMPLRANRDYQSLARRTFLVEELPQGALPTYDRDLGIEDLPPVGEPLKLPNWVRVGQWVYRKATDSYARISEVKLLEVSTVEWRTERFECRITTAFLRDWQPVDPPREPRPAWDRLLLDDEDF